MVRKSNIRSGGPAAAARTAVAPAARREQERRRSILRAAATTFRRRGFAATGMRDIAKEADLSAANLYYYFPSKGSLLTYCQDRSLDRLLLACREARARGGGADARLEHVLRAHLHCTLDEMDGAAAHLEVDELPADDRERIVAKRDRYERAVRRIVEEGIARGTFVPCDARLVTRAILGALNWTARWYDPAGPTSRPALENAYAGYLLRGLMKR